MRLQPNMDAFRKYQGSRPLIASHKGRNGGFVAESTDRAFQLALRDGADILETDVCRTSDGQLFLMHGPNLDRYTNGSGPIAEHTMAQIRELRHRSANGTVDADQFLLLDDFLKLYRDVCLINLDRCFDFLPEAFAHVKTCGMGHQVLLKSSKNLEEAYHWLEKERFEPNFMPIIDQNEQGLDLVLDTLKYYPYPAVELVFRTEDERAASPAVIETLHRAGVKVWINSLTLNCPLCAHHDDIRSLFDSPDLGWGWLRARGADVILTDYVREALNYFERPAENRAE